MIIKQLEMARFDQGLTKSQLCEKANISRATYNKFLKGEDINLGSLKKLLDVIKFDLSITERVHSAVLFENLNL